MTRIGIVRFCLINAYLEVMTSHDITKRVVMEGFSETLNIES
jgi:hypothetical protein